MRLATFLPPGAQEPVSGEIRDGEAISFGDGSSVWHRLATADHTPADGERWPLTQVTLQRPVLGARAIYCIGLNYRGHAAETGMEIPEFPMVFLKPPGAAAAPGATIRCPRVVRRLDYEGELCLVIGGGGGVGGYCVADDVTGRDLQAREPQWARAKGADGFCPYGPWITTPDDVEDPHDLRLRTWVNGELRQDSSTGDLIFGVDELVRFVSETCALQPGDLILTGTPSGVGMALDPPRFLEPGDVVRIEIDKLGYIEHNIG